MEIRESARKHGLGDDDIRHAVEHPLARDELKMRSLYRRLLPEER